MLTTRLCIVAAASWAFFCSTGAHQEGEAPAGGGGQPPVPPAEAVMATCSRFVEGYNAFNETIDDSLWESVTGERPRRLELPRRIAQLNKSVLFANESIAVVRVDDGPTAGVPTGSDHSEPMTYLIGLRKRSGDAWKVQRFDEVTVRRKPRDEYVGVEPDVAVLRSALVGLVELTGNQDWNKKWDFLYPGRQQVFESKELYRLVERSRTHRLVSELEALEQSGSTMLVRLPQLIERSAERAVAIVSVDVADKWQSPDGVTSGKGKSTTDYVVVWQRDFGGTWKVFLVGWL